MPVEGATAKDYHSQSFWYYPWGKSVTHKGVDIFAKKGTNVHSATKGFVVYCGQVGLGGNMVLILGPKWRVHYYAHLNEIKTTSFRYVNQQSVIGTVGNSGNAVSKSPHLHYTISTPIPYIWRKDNSVQGWKKMFYLNPIDYFN
ncbi:MAG: M23 family metallopeptidase [Flavobacteriales bacterium]|nr:M23 family metallopeptidase [Flavobacteriales bacterium]